MYSPLFLCMNLFGAVLFYNYLSISHYGENRIMSRPLYTVPNKSQIKALIKLQMTLSLHAPSSCNEVTHNKFQVLRRNKSFDNMCLKFQLPQCIKARLFYSLHCGWWHTVSFCHCYSEWHICHFSIEWYNFPIHSCNTPTTCCLWSSGA